MKLISFCFCIMMGFAANSHASENHIIAINDFWNAIIQPADDIQVHGKDHWQTPQQSLKLRTGDCDDYAVAKYYTLLAMGVPASSIRIASVALDLRGDVSLHLVVIYTDALGTWVLDNIAPEVMRLEARWDIKYILATYDEKGVTTWHRKPPRVANTPKMWQAMSANATTHITAAKAAYLQRGKI